MQRTTRGPRGHRPLYRTALSLAVAALAAALLPFTVLYVSALSHRPAAQIASVTYSRGQRILTTRTSGGQTVRTVVGSSAQQQTQAVTPVSTHAS